MMNSEKPEQLCQYEQGYWPETIERWRKEGLPEGIGPWDDCGITHYFRPPNFQFQSGLFPPFEYRVLEEDETSRVVQTGMGIICRVSKIGSRLPQFIKHPVSNRDDFEAIKERLDPKAPGRYPESWDEWAASAAGFPHIICLGGSENGFFGWLRELMGLEGLLMAYVDQPDFIHEICRYHVNFLKELYERALREVQFDFVFMWEDMCYKSGPLISPAFFRTFMLPYYKEIVDFYRQLGVKWIIVDSDGNVSQLIPLFLEAGVDGLLPFEVAAGMDIRKVRKEFPTLKIIGGIDKREIAKGPEAIDRELELKLPVMFRSGGCIPGIDHHVPPEVSYDDFQYYLRRCREIYRSI
jgi:hypothetical protein